MSNYHDCPKCKALCVDKRFHQCPPVWRVRFHDYGPDEAREVHAYDAEDAATAYVEGAEVESVSPDDVIVVGDDGVERRFSVSGEYSVVWSASEVITPEPTEAPDGRA